MNNTQEIGNEIVEKIETRFGLEKGETGTSAVFGDLIALHDIDSLDLMALYQKIEEDYEVNLDDYEEECGGSFHDMSRFRVSDLAEYISRTKVN